MAAPTVLCLMGPTAAGKTGFATRLAEDLPVDIISVDSALVYRGMDIGTAKPDSALLEKVPHRLIDIRDPEQGYSAGEFVRDAEREIELSLRAGRIPLLVGGTMMYFRSLTEGLADLPVADAATRAAIDEEAARLGWPALHAQLAENDPVAAARINPNDSQRIQRALEVFRRSGKSLTDWQNTAGERKCDYRYVKIALIPESRSALHERIQVRLKSMFEHGFVGEVQSLMRRPGLTVDHASMRAVGYRQVWAHLAGWLSLQEAADKALYATRQLAKRQLTWLRSESGLHSVDPLKADSADTLWRVLDTELSPE
jgi:tRNA dimethylallyltransferase